MRAASLFGSDSDSDSGSDSDSDSDAGFDYVIS